MIDAFDILFPVLAAGASAGAVLGLLLYLDDRKKNKRPAFRAETTAEADRD